MATYEKGILREFSGKVGSVVGGNWRGIALMRSRPRKKKNPTFSEDQQVQHARFKLVAGFINSIKHLLPFSFETQPGETARNTALRATVREAIDGLYPNFTVNYANVEVAKGSLMKADNPIAISPEAGKIRFNWGDNSDLGSNKDDKSILVAYCPELDAVLYTVEGPSRETGEGILDLPRFAGKQVHTWIAFRSPKGKLRSGSIYTGMVAVL